MSEQTAEITRNANEATAVLDRRLTVVEQAVKHMPNNADLATLSGEVMTVKATVEGIKDSLTGMSSSVHRIENFLLRHSRGD